MGVKKAFDNMSQLRLAQILHDKFGVHIALAFALGMVDRRITAQVVGFLSDPIPMCWGGKQGGRATPFLWHEYIDASLYHTFDDLSPGEGVSTQGHMLSHAI